MSKSKKKVSKFAIYKSDIESVISDHNNDKIGYTALARKVLKMNGVKDEHEVNVLRTYIKRSYSDQLESTPKILVYDLETSRINFKRFWTGKQYLSHRDIRGESTRIITVAWKWLGDDKVSHLTWDSNKSDKKLVKEFLKIYNTADQVIGINNDNFDNRLLAARAAKYDLEFNHLIKSFDVQKKAKRAFRLPSYSMAYMAEYFGVSNKLSHEGMVMWDKIEDGTKAEQKEYLKKMIDYNIGDIISTEDLYLRLRKYFTGVTNFATIKGKDRWACPECGSEDVEFYNTTVTSAGTVQRIMKCRTCDTLYKISNTQYIKFLNSKL